MIVLIAKTSPRFQNLWDVFVVQRGMGHSVGVILLGDDRDAAVFFQDAQLDLAQVAQPRFVDGGQYFIFTDTLVTHGQAIEAAPAHQDGWRAEETAFQEGPADEEIPNQAVDQQQGDDRDDADYQIAAALGQGILDGVAEQ